ncbi:MAG: aldo/keto reductase [Burkholderiaceae bacterium]|nr:aldo/keto reductase [Burkholderiaceae bacterium]
MNARVLLGSTDLRVSPLGFGCSTIASLATRHTPAEVQATLLAAVERGVNFFDTADVYGQGDSERLLGRLLAGRREPLVVCTKVGMRLSHSQAVIRLVKPVLNPLLRRWRGGRAHTTSLRQASQRQCFEPQYLRSHVEGSLRRLRVERIDLLLLHSPPVEVAERDDVLALLQGLRDSGKLRWFGVSAAQISHAPRWARWPDLHCLQLPLTPGVDPLGRVCALPTDVLALLSDLRARGIGVIAREVFGGGALAGVRSQALAAVLAAPAVAVALIGMGSRAHLEENLRSLAGIGGPDRTGAFAS